MRLKTARVTTKEMGEWTEEDRKIMKPFVEVSVGVKRLAFPLRLKPRD